MENVGFGVIGAGTWGALHARVYANTPGGRLAAVCDMDLDRARAATEGIEGVQVYRDHQKMLEDRAVQAVSVVLPDFLHRDAVIACARAGKHILVEKPLATTEEDALTMIRAAREAGVHLYVDFHTRWSPLLAPLKAAHDAGEIGEPQLAYYRASNTTFVPTQMLKWAGRSSVAWFLASHCLDTLLWLVNARGGQDTVERVTCVTRSRVLKSLGVDTPDFYQTTLEWRSGFVTQLENSWILPEGAPTVVDVKVEWLGSKGAFYIDGSSHGAVQKIGTALSYPDAFVSSPVHGEPSGYGVESIRHFARCVIGGKKPVTDGLDGLAVTRLILKMEESARLRQPVDVGDLYSE